MSYSPQVSIKKLKDTFLLHRRNWGFSNNATDNYQRQLDDFEKFASTQNVFWISEVTTDLLNAYILHLEDKGYVVEHLYRKLQGLKAFFKWYGKQVDVRDWQNPIKKLRLPTQTSDPVRHAIIADIKVMIETCKSDFKGVRDKAIMLCLLDTGAKAEEFISMNVVDVDLSNGHVVIRKRKTGKSQRIPITSETSLALRNYLRLRPDKNSPALWISSSGNRLTVQTLPTILRQYGQMASIYPPTVKDFRRASEQKR